MAKDIPSATLWNHTYWTEPWQNYSAVGNSIPLFLAGLALSLVLIKPADGRARWQSLPALFPLAALTHLIGDFPVHNSDAHTHFWPFTDWRFHSPLSYWEAAHHGRAFFIAEVIADLALIATLVRRWRKRPSARANAL